MNDQSENSGITVGFVFPDGVNEKFTGAVFPCLPRIGDKVRSATPESGVYRVKAVSFLVHDFDSVSRKLPETTIEVALEALDEIGGG